MPTAGNKVKVVAVANQQPATTDGDTIYFNLLDHQIFVGSTAVSNNYSLSISGNQITLTSSDGTTSTVTLPVYNGAVSDGGSEESGSSV